MLFRVTCRGGAFARREGMKAARRVFRACSNEASTGENSIEVTEADLPGIEDFFKFIVPGFCTVVASASMSSVDKSFVGRRSTLELAALGPSSAAFDSTSYLMSFLNTATISLLAGACDSKAARRVRSHALVLAASSATVLAVALCACARSIVTLLGASPDMMLPAVSYLRLRAIGLPAERLISIATAFCFAKKDSTTSFLLTIVCLILNIFGDCILCPRYGADGVAIASVFAAVVGFAFLAFLLHRRGLWPRPLDLPTKFNDVLCFGRFAGPVFASLVLKSAVLADMTKRASVLGIKAAATHQVLSTLFLLSAVALGNPFSWAMQAFLPPLLQKRSEEIPRSRCPGQRRTSSAELVFGRLFKAACVCAFLASLTVVYCCKHLGWLFCRDAAVLGELSQMSVQAVPFLTLYPILLMLEGALYSTQREGAVCLMSLAFVFMSRGMLHLVGESCLGQLWLVNGLACLVTMLAGLGCVMRALRLQR
eukprot:TRINITY_DN80005_c0_g1_i1.p1 TRINITY_DN80005_c0_g1~~TRINITY_DN80005_c0_g1_i1.p1  ORF type:complete len:483 (+),score=72.00 TRINITY_DN80005_c0_g1_i1:61-1509(+)